MSKNLTLGLIALILSSIVRAQPQLPGSNETIVVQGERIQSLATDFVEHVIPTQKGTQLARWEEPICAKVIGLNAKVEREIRDRIDAVSRAVKFDVAKPNCAPNLLLLVVPNKKEALETFRRERAEYVRRVSPDLLSAMADSPAPYASWQLAELVAADGMPIGESDTRPGGGNLAQDEKGIFYDFNAARLKTTVMPSRLRANTKSRFKSALILVEAGALTNLDSRQLADFAMLQAMLPPDRRMDPPPSSSILSVFNTLPVPNEAPQSLTFADVAFLKSLRSVRSDSNISIQKNQIRLQMIEELEKSE